jgi:N-acetylglucosamine kinase-like BadF-type ATPase
LIIGGIDAGGTATKCLIINEKGEMLAEAETGSANYLSVGFKKTVIEIEEALSIAVAKAGVTKVDLLGIGLAGVGRPEDIKKIRKALLPLSLAEKVYLTNDGEIALYGAHQGRPGIIVIAGTGSIVYGKGKDGQIYRAGGWGPILGDEGSGCWTGLEALKALIAVQEGRGAETILRKAVMEKLKMENLQELIPFVYQKELPRRKLASLAPLVIRAMQKGDQVSAKIINKGLNHLALLVNHLKNKLDLDSGQIAVTGGLFNSEIIYKMFAEKIYNMTGLEIRRPSFSPVYGACFLIMLKSGLMIPSITEIKGISNYEEGVEK